MSMRLSGKFSSIPQTRVQIHARHATKKASSNEPKNDVIQKALYPSNIRNRETPTGIWRSDVGKRLQLAIPSKQAHETIERAWLLRNRRVRESLRDESARKFEKMRAAMSELERIDPHRFKACNVQEDPRVRIQGDSKKVRRDDSRLPGLFPREMRIPTDTPSRTGWVYDLGTRTRLVPR